MRLHRLIAILLLVESRGTVKAKALAEALEVSKRTIYRDIDTLCECGIPLITTTGPLGGISFTEKYSVDFKHFYGDEVIQLYLTGMGIRPGDEIDTKLKLQNALLKLEHSLPDSFKADIIKVKERIYHDPTPWWGEMKELKHLEKLRQAVLQNLKIEIEYRKYNDELSFRFLFPYGLVVKQLDWYLVAFDNTVNAVRIFKCDRIKTVQLLEDNFEVDDKFSLEAYWKDADSMFKQKKSEEETYPVKLRVSKFYDFILTNLEIFDSYDEGDDIYALVNLYKFDFACTEALEIVGFAEILEPFELREFVKQHLKSQLKFYT